MNNRNFDLNSGLFKRVSSLLDSDEAHDIFDEFSELLGVSPIEVAGVLEMVLKKRETDGKKSFFIFSPWNRFSNSEIILHAMTFYTQTEAIRFQKYFVRCKGGAFVDGYNVRPHVWFEW